MQNISQSICLTVLLLLVATQYMTETVMNQAQVNDGLHYFISKRFGDPNVNCNITPNDSSCPCPRPRCNPPGSCGCPRCNPAGSCGCPRCNPTGSCGCPRCNPAGSCGCPRCNPTGSCGCPRCNPAGSCGCPRCNPTGSCGCPRCNPPGSCGCPPCDCNVNPGTCYDCPCTSCLSMIVSYCPPLCDASVCCGGYIVGTNCPIPGRYVVCVNIVFRY